LSRLCPPWGLLSIHPAPGTHFSHQRNSHYISN
jgi:hypothetical protein